MEYVQMADDLKFSRVVLGFWRLLDWGLSTDQLIDYLHEVLDLGITTMDQADIYGNYQAEELLGEALKKDKSLAKQMQFVTKCGIVYKGKNGARVKYYDYSKKWIMGQVEKSLSFMGIDHIDLLLLHRPSPLMDPDEIADAFSTLKQQGKVTHFGVSNFLPDEFDLLQSSMDEPLITNQVEFSALHMGNMENGVLNQCLKNKIHPMLWSPLAGGAIFTSDAPEAVRLRETLEVIREEVGADDIDAIAFAWLLAHPTQPLPITGSGEIGLAKRPVEALKYKLTYEQWFMIWTAVKGHKVP
jgi:predicted oxidoreductase